MENSMGRNIFIFILLLLLSGCSTFNIETEIRENTKLDNLKSTGIIFRIPKSSQITLREYRKTINHWLKGHKLVKKLKILPYTEADLASYDTELDRFYQLSINRDFLKYKSIGVIYQYLHSNESTLTKMMHNNKLDSYIIFEIDSYFSPEMEHIDFNSLIAIVDKNMKIIYLDHQKILYQVDEYDPDRVKAILLNKISKRLLDRLSSFDYID